MSVIEIIFYIFGGLTVLSALGVLFSSNILYSAISLLASLLGVAGLFVLSSADFLAVTQILIYVGGVTVLMIFGIMVTKRVSKDNEPISFAHNKGAGLVLGAIVLGVLSYFAFTLNPMLGTAIKGQESTTLPIIGEKLMTDYLFPFEIAAVFLLIVLIGAIFIAGKKITEK